MWDYIIDWLAELAIRIVQLFPEADVEGLTAFFEPMSRFLGWVYQLNEVLPLAEVFSVVGFTLGIVGALYVVMFVRRVFSLIWPGAGS